MSNRDFNTTIRPSSGLRGSEGAAQLRSGMGAGTTGCLGSSAGGPAAGSSSRSGVAARSRTAALRPHHLSRTSPSATSSAPAAPPQQQQHTAVNDAVLLEVVCRDAGVPHVAQRLLRAGMRSVGDLRQKGRLLLSLVPSDVAVAIVTAARLPVTTLEHDIRAASAPRSPHGAQSQRRSDHGGSSHAAAADVDDINTSRYSSGSAVANPHDEVWAELKGYEGEAEERLRRYAQLHADNMLSAAGRSLQRKGCTLKPRRSQAEVSRAAVDRAKAQLALCRSGLRALRELRAVEGQAPLAARTGSLADPERLQTMGALLEHLQSVVTALAVQRQHWRDDPTAIFDSAQQQQQATIFAAQQDEVAALREEVAALRALLAANHVDSSVIPATDDVMAAKHHHQREEEGAAGGATSARGSSHRDANTFSVPHAAGGAVPAPEDLSAFITNSLKLPLSRSPEDLARRQKLFRDFDANGNGYLSLAEIDKGARDVLKLPALFDAKPVLLLAYRRARDLTGGAAPTTQSPSGNGRAPNQQQLPRFGAQSPSSDLAASFVEKREFRVLLLYIAAYFDIWSLFRSIDTDTIPGEQTFLSFEEFAAGVAADEINSKLEAQRSASGGGGGSGVPKPSVLRGVIPEQAWDEINVDGSAKVSFTEFAEWALARLTDQIMRSARAAAADGRSKTSTAPQRPSSSSTTTTPRRPAVAPERPDQRNGDGATQSPTPATAAGVPPPGDVKRGGSEPLAAQPVMTAPTPPASAPVSPLEGLSSSNSAAPLLLRDGGQTRGSSSTTLRTTSGINTTTPAAGSIMTTGSMGDENLTPLVGDVPSSGGGADGGPAALNSWVSHGVLLHGGPLGAGGGGMNGSDLGSETAWTSNNTTNCHSDVQVPSPTGASTRAAPTGLGGSAVSGTGGGEALELAEVASEASTTARRDDDVSAPTSVRSPPNAAAATDGAAQVAPVAAVTASSSGESISARGSGGPHQPTDSQHDQRTEGSAEGQTVEDLPVVAPKISVVL